MIYWNFYFKVYDSSRTARDICKAKKVKSMRVVQGKIYIGCKDSSIQVQLKSLFWCILVQQLDIKTVCDTFFQELTIATKREQEIKAPTKSWIMQKKPINAIVVYRDWLYSASSVIEGSKVKVRAIHINLGTVLQEAFRDAEYYRNGEHIISPVYL